MTVPVFLPSHHLRDAVSHALHKSGIPYSIHVQPREFSSACRSADAAVLVVPWLNRDFALAKLMDLVTSYPCVEFVLVTDSHPENLRLLGNIGCRNVVFLNAELTLLGQAVERARQESYFTRWARLIRVQYHLPLALRKAMACALEQQPPSLPIDDLGATVPHSVRQLANLVGYSEDYLGRLARGTGVDLPGYLKWCVALRALQLRSSPAANWEEIAWCLGFESLSGLSEHLKRVWGRRPRQLDTRHPVYWFDRFERQFLPAGAEDQKNDRNL